MGDRINPTLLNIWEGKNLLLPPTMRDKISHSSWDTVVMGMEVETRLVVMVGMVSINMLLIRKRLVSIDFN